jgi:hypothetical protein
MIDDGIIVEDRKIKKTRNPFADLMCIWANTRAMPDPEMNHCQMHDQPMCLERRDQESHKHGKKQVGLCQILSHYFNLSSIKLKLSKVKGEGNYFVDNPFASYLFCPILNCDYVTSEGSKFNKHWCTHTKGLEDKGFNEMYQIYWMNKCINRKVKAINA